MRRSVPRPVVDRLHAWVERCQAETWASSAGVDEACAALVRITTAAPPGLPVAQRAVVRRLLNDAWSRVLALVICASAPAGDDEAARGTGRPPVDIDSRAAALLAEIDRRHADPRLKLATVARQLAVSPSHLTQILKAATGRTFGAHVHTRRVADARALLEDSTLSVKEIASRVGYSTTTQLDRHFRKVVRCPPTVYRASLRQAHHVGAGDGAVPRARYGEPPTQPLTHPQK